MSWDSGLGSTPPRGNGRELQGERPPLARREGQGWQPVARAWGELRPRGGGGAAGWGGLWTRAKAPEERHVCQTAFPRSRSSRALGRPQRLHPQDRGAGGEGHRGTEQVVKGESGLGRKTSTGA